MNPHHLDRRLLRSIGLTRRPSAMRVASQTLGLVSLGAVLGAALSWAARSERARQLFTRRRSPAAPTVAS